MDWRRRRSVEPSAAIIGIVLAKGISVKAMPAMPAPIASVGMGGYRAQKSTGEGAIVESDFGAEGRA